MIRRRVAPLVAVAALGVSVGCSSSEASSSSTTVTVASSSESASTTTDTSTTTSSTTSTSTTDMSTTDMSTTDMSTTTSVALTPHSADFLGEEVVGTSVLGRPIIASHRGTPGGTVVLVVGVIHGNENAGLAIVDDLRTAPLPAGIDLWLIDAINPDGVAGGARGNAHGVDLNRNFPHDWTAISSPGEWEYSGTGPASEPETQAFIAFAQRIHPRLTLWYHQDLARISPSTGPDAALRQRYAQRTGLAYESITGGTYTGVAATWVRRTVADAMSFVVELPPSLSTDDALVHTAAVLEIATMVDG